jgi:DNA-binding GntR family transcriptional regulator
MSTPTLSIHQPEAADARSLSDQAYYRIRELIVTLELAPGSPVSERELMERLALGRTPIREALQALARECLVEVYPRRGMFVSGVDVRDLAGLSEVRLTLEPRAARLAAERATDADRASIALLLKELEHIHRHIYEWTHNPFLAATLNEYYVLTLRIWFLALDRVTRLEDAVREHRELLRAIRAGNAERAEEAMRRHVTGFEDAIRRVL